MHTGFHQAHYVAERVLGEVESIQQNVINILKKHEQDSTTSVPATEAPTTSTSSNSTHLSSITQDEKVFAATDPQNSYLIKIIKDLQDEIKTMKAGKDKPINRNRNTSKYCGHMEHAVIPAKNVGAREKDTKMKQGDSKINSEEVINDANQPTHDGGGRYTSSEESTTSINM